MQGTLRSPYKPRIKSSKEKLNLWKMGNSILFDCCVTKEPKMDFKNKNWIEKIRNIIKVLWLMERMQFVEKQMVKKLGKIFLKLDENSIFNFPSCHKLWQLVQFKIIFLTKCLNIQSVEYIIVNLQLIEMHVLENIGLAMAMYNGKL